MLSGKGNENGEKTTVGLISRKELCTCSTLLLYLSLPLFCKNTTCNLQTLPGYTFYGGNVLRLVHLFLMPFIYVLVAHFLITASKLSCCFSNKKMSPLFFIPRCCTVALFLVELRWPVAYFLFFSVFTFLYIHSKFVDMTINLSLKL